MELGARGVGLDVSATPGFLSRPREWSLARGEPVLQLDKFNRVLDDAQAEKSELGVVGVELEADDARLLARDERDCKDCDGAEETTPPGAGEE